jgi:hypothetical protein
MRSQRVLHCAVGPSKLRPVTDRELSISLPLDADGFLRRECPECERECKWLYSDDSEPAPSDGYACPYCAKRATPDRWWTPAQADFAAKSAGNAVLGEMFDQFQRSDFDVSKTPRPTLPSEVDDMRRVDFSCHPGEPVKVREDWDRPVHCIVCAAA